SGVLEKRTGEVRNAGRPNGRAKQRQWPELGPKFARPLSKFVTDVFRLEAYLSFPGGWLLFTGVSAMAFTGPGYFQTKGLQLVVASLKGVMGKPVSHVQEDRLYRQEVIQPGWESLPVAIRMLMKRRYGQWNELYAALRDEVFDLRGDRVKLHPDMSDR